MAKAASDNSDSLLSPRVPSDKVAPSGAILMANLFFLFFSFPFLFFFFFFGCQKATRLKILLDGGMCYARSQYALSIVVTHGGDYAFLLRRSITINV